MNFLKVDLNISDLNANPPQMMNIALLNQKAKEIEVWVHQKFKTNFLYGEKLNIKYIETKLDEQKNNSPVKQELND